jgi:tetratricopeptide (TPR) repeat protein
MERKSYRLILFFVFVLPGVLSAQVFKTEIYNAYIAADMGSWKNVIDNMEGNNQKTPDFLLNLINYEYGYIGWCLGTNNKDEAEKYLELAEENLETLANQTSKFNAEIYAYRAAFLGYKIGLKNLLAPFLGPKSMKNAEIALEADPNNFNANLELGNIWSNMPEMFGGSNEKALKYYKKALKIMENKGNEAMIKNWMHLNLLATIGKIEVELGNIESGRNYFETALKIEPEFLWVKNELLPSLQKEQKD